MKILSQTLILKYLCIGPTQIFVSFCSSCGLRLKPDWNNCINCGVVVESAASPDPASYSDLELMQSGWTVNQIYDLRHSSTNVQTSNPEKVSQSSDHDSSKNTCSNCGKMLFEGWRKCSHCGNEQEIQISKHRDWDNPERSDIDGPFYSARKYHQYLSSRTFFNKLDDIFSIIGIWSVPLGITIVMLDLFIFKSGVAIFVVFLIPGIVKTRGLDFLVGPPNDSPFHRYERNKGYDGKKIYHCTYCEYSVTQSWTNDPRKLMAKHWKDHAHFEDYDRAISHGVIVESRYQFIARMSRKYKRIPFLIELIIVLISILLFINIGLLGN